MSSGAETPRNRRGKGRKHSPASGSLPSTAAATAAGGDDGGGGGGGSGGAGAGGSFTSPLPSAKKLKIFDYFGAVAPSTPQARKEPARRGAGNRGSARTEDRKIWGEVDKQVKTGALSPSPTRSRRARDAARESHAAKRGDVVALFIRKRVIISALYGLFLFFERTHCVVLRWGGGRAANILVPASMTRLLQEFSATGDRSLLTVLRRSLILRLAR